MKGRKAKTPRKTANEERLDSARVFGVEQAELALAHAEVMQMMAHAAMSSEWSPRWAAKRWPDFAPTTELGKYVHRIVTEAVAKAKAGRTE